jgi:hypothetical protein
LPHRTKESSAAGWTNPVDWCARPRGHPRASRCTRSSASWNGSLPRPKRATPTPLDDGEAAMANELTELKRKLDEATERLKRANDPDDRFALSRQRQRSGKAGRARGGGGRENRDAPVRPQSRSLA